MDEDQAEYFVILTEDRYKAQSISNMTRTSRFMMESNYQDDVAIERKFIAIAGQEAHVLQEAKRYWDTDVLLVCIQCLKTSNSKHLLRALKKIYGPGGNSNNSRITFSGQEMILHAGTSFNNVKSAAKLLGQNLNHHYAAFQEFCESVSVIIGTHHVNLENEVRCRELQEENEILWRKIEELEGVKVGQRRVKNVEKEPGSMSLFQKVLAILVVLWIVFGHKYTEIHQSN